MSFLCAIPLIASLLSGCAAEETLAVGYVEGDYVLLAPIETAQIRSVGVRRGDHVEPGAVLAELESDDASLAVTEAEASLAQAEAQLADLKLGKRPEEIAVLEAALRSAKAEATEAERVLRRATDLNRRGIAAEADFDKAKTSLELANASVGEAEANLVVASLPAREETIRAAENQVEVARALLEQARWRLAKRTITAPSPGRVDDIIRNPGDISGPTAPVLSLLPDGAIKLKLYVPEPAFSSIEVGSLLDVRCDGCPEGLRARVSYVSPDPEFTPPVIYSLETRQKLVHLVEARPDGDARMLKPGQIVDVTRAADSEQAR
ncbi:HlyD family efflux transporter periplasmic adaptor subunit [Aquamicrobium sp. LC103]|uniref:HlyD family secretion protein n=1 Tax=Aquamicrobium sp. LC103 TaxID=1120658 RepID=UPI00063EA2EA|nr:HlyD family efflux transporter periplasmic adaptor subunit [Aquamicrobium sp. LC103]TKT69122.1 HlyD family efflux transporter periplasmic adaptor subunit [Aquamicrobium sp. LC103]